MLFNRRVHATDDELSAYLDARLDGGSRERVGSHLDGCARCREALDGLRVVQASLRALPRARARRSFALRPADVRLAPRSAGVLGRTMPLLSGVTALALFSFLALVSIDVLGGSSGNSGTKSAARPAAFGSLSAGSPRVTEPAAAADALAATVTANTYQGDLRKTAEFAANPPATAPLVYSEQQTATVSAPAAPGPASGTPTASSEAPPLSGLNPTPTALEQTGAVAPEVRTPTPILQPTRPPEATVYAPVPNEATPTAGSAPAPGTNRTEGSAPTITGQQTRTPLPTLASAPAAAPGGSSDDTRLHAAEAALAAVALVSGGGLVVAWRRRS